MSASRRNSIKQITPQTPRRQEIIRRVMAGESNNTMALEMGLSFETVREHVKVLRKAGIIVDRRDGTRTASRLRYRPSVSVG